LLHQAGVLIYHCMMHGNMKLKLLIVHMFVAKIWLGILNI